MERKLTAILAADVVGYSRLVGADEAGTIARLKALRKELIEPLVAEHRGRIVKLMGDGALVEFPSAVDAVECAVAIQKGVSEREAIKPEDRRIAFRIGINIGDIIIEGDDILGDGVNVAARLEALAEPGGICVARNVYNQVKAKLDLAFETMGEHRVKNITEPVETFRVALDGVVTAPAASRRRPRVMRWLVPALAALLAIVLMGGVLALLARRTAAQGQAGNRGAALREPGRGRGNGATRGRDHRGHHHRPRPLSRPRRDRPQLDRGLQGQAGRRSAGRARI